ncbi:hypothetical protein MACH24_08540 [Erythrobacter sp. Dej080120_24]|nr:hypothetical protein MACH24_08540 [Erythrobacter sp. Dej080120_24]
MYAEGEDWALTAAGMVEVVITPSVTSSLEKDFILNLPLRTTGQISFWLRLTDAPTKCIVRVAGAKCLTFAGYCDASEPEIVGTAIRTVVVDSSHKIVRSR